ncbi:MAG: WD40 repeat domain-containing protein [Gemmataceae bacterium]
MAEFTADDSHVACVSGGHVRLWPVHATPPGDHILGRVASIGPPQLSADGRRVLTVRNNAQGGEAFAQVWDAATGRPIARRSVADIGSFPGLASIFSPDGRRVLFYRSLVARTTAPSPATEAHLWDVDQDRLLPLPDKSAGGLTGEFSPDGREFVTIRGWAPVGPGKGSKEDVTFKCQLWDAATGKSIGPVVTARRGVDTFRGNAPYVLWAGRPTLMVNPQRVLAKEKLDGKESGPVRRFDLRTGQELPPLKVPAAFLQTGGPPGSSLPSVSADGRRLLFSNRPVAFTPRETTARMLLIDQETDKTLRRWDIPTGSTGGAIGGPFGGGRGGVTRIGARLSADGTRVAVVLDEDGAARPRLWNADTGEAITSPLTNELGVNLIRFSPDGRKLATANEVGVVRLWDAADGRPATPPIEVGRGQVFVWFSQDGSVLFTRRLVNPALPPINRGRGEVRLWSTASGQSLTPPMTSTRPLLARGPAGPAGRFVGFDGEVPDFVAAEVQLPGADRVALLDSGTAGLRDLTPTTLPVTELLSLASVLGGRRIDAGNLERRTEPEFLAGCARPRAARRRAGEPARSARPGTRPASPSWAGRSRSRPPAGESAGPSPTRRGRRSPPAGTSTG